MKSRRLVASVVILAAVVVVGSAAPALGQKKRVVLACSQATSSFYTQCVAVAQVINEQVPALDVSVMETGGAVASMKLLLNERADIALTTTDQAYLAWHGLENWKETPFKDIRALVYTTSSANYLIVREDSGIQSIQGLSGRKFNPGMRGSSTERLTQMVLEDLGIKPDWQRMAASDAVAGIIDNRIVGYAKVGSGFAFDGPTMEIAAKTKIRVLPFTEEEAKKSRTKHPFLSWAKVPANTIKGTGEFWAPAVSSGFTVRKSFPADLAYAVIKAVSSEKGAATVKAAFPGFTADARKLTVDVATSPLHVGVLKYVVEQGQQVSDDLVPPEKK